VPAAHKGAARLVIGSVILSPPESLNLRFPRVDKASLEEFAQVRRVLEGEGKTSTGRRKKAAKKK